MMDLMCFLARLKGVREVAGPVSESGVFSVGAVGSTGLSTGLRRASANGAGTQCRDADYRFGNGFLHTYRPGRVTEGCN